MCKCNLCQKENNNLERKIAILNEKIFNALYQQYAFLPHTQEVGVKIDLVENHIEAYEVCEECLNADVFKYTNDLYLRAGVILLDDKFDMSEVITDDVVESLEQALSNPNQPVQETRQYMIDEEKLGNVCSFCEEEFDKSQLTLAMLPSEAFLEFLTSRPQEFYQKSPEEIILLLEREIELTQACSHCLEESVKPITELLAKNGIMMQMDVNKDNTENPLQQEVYSGASPFDPSNNYVGVTGNGSPFAKPTNSMEKFATNMLSEESIKKIKEKQISGREKEIEKMVHILSKVEKNNPILIGEPGVGKTTVMEKLALDIYEGNVPLNLQDVKVYELMVSDLMAGTKYRGELEAKVSEFIKTVKKEGKGKVIIFMDEIHQLAVGGAGSSDNISVKDILKPALSDGSITLVGSTTIDEYKKSIENDKSLKRRFQPVFVNEPTDEETQELLQNARARYEEFHKVTISDAIIEEAVYLSKRYIKDRHLPDKAFDLIDQASASVKINNNTIETDSYINHNNGEIARLKKDFKDSPDTKELISDLQVINKSLKKDLVVQSSDLHKVINAWTGINVEKLSQSSSAEIKNLNVTLSTKVIGQKEATDSVAKVIKRFKVGLQNPNKPISVQLLLGPTGTGKTELAKATSELLDVELIRFDLSEYSEKHEAAKLIGSAPGYIGYDEGGLLTEKVKRNPNAVILLDEIEKGHPDIMNTFLQVFDEGHLTDNKGNKVDFRNTIIFLTSNIITDLKEVSAKSIGFKSISNNSNDKEMKEARKRVTDNLKAKGLKPEFLNRIDDIILFNELNEEAIREICVKKLNEKVADIQVTNKYIASITYDNSLIDFLVTKGYDKEFGARPLNRAIEENVSDSLTDFLIEEKVFNRKSKINCKVIVDNNEVKVVKL